MNSLGINLQKNARVVVKAQFMTGNPTEAERVFVCRGGFGMKSFTFGSGIIGYWEKDGEQGRIEGFMIEKLAPLCCCLDPVHPGDNPDCKYPGHWIGRDPWQAIHDIAKRADQTDQEGE